MTQTQTPPEGTPDPDRRPDRTPGPDETQTRTPSDAQTQTRPDPDPDPDSDPDPDPDPSPGLSPGPESEQVRTPDPDPDPDSDRRKASKINNSGPESGPESAQTRTRTPADRGRAAVTGAKKVRGWLGAGGYLTALTIVVGIVASVGQKKYAETKAKFVHQIQIFGVDLSPWFAPFVFDLFVAALLHGGLRAARARNSPWPWWISGAIVAGLSTYTNFDHDGGMITGTASIGLFLAWSLYLTDEYKTIIRNREVEDSADEEFRSTDVLFTVNKPLAQRAWMIARTKPLAAGLEYRHRLGETQLSKRDLAIMCATIELDVLADQLDVQLNPAVAAPAGSTSDDEKKTKRVPVRWWQRRRRRRALRIAKMTAGDAVDRLLGLPIPERSGVVIARVGYAEQDAQPLLGAVTAPLHVPAIAPAAAAPALPPVTQQAIAAPRRRPAATPAPTEIEVTEETPAVVVPAAPVGAPRGNAGVNWLPIEAIAGLPPIDPNLMCECATDPTKWCGGTLVDHVQRRGRYVVEVISGVENWVWREERIGKNVIKAVTGMGSSGNQQELAGLFDHLRVLAQAHLSQDAVPVAEIEAAPTASAVVEEVPPES